MCYSQGEGLYIPLSRLFYLALYPLVQLYFCTLSQYGTQYSRCWTSACASPAPTSPQHEVHPYPTVLKSVGPHQHAKRVVHFDFSHGAASSTGMLELLSLRTRLCTSAQKLLLLEREEQDEGTIRRAAHRSGLEIELTKRTVPG